MALLMRASARGLVLLATLGFPPAAAAQSAVPAGSLEYQVKAAYLLNFARYVSWPEGAFASPTAPLPICVLGADPFGNALDEVVAGQGARD
ncbi:MAG TPA: YfiR family protein, partial [Gemmatimonadales bacterium]|nr:YfiR family protein [Gemmatimonadales bacterium]